VSSREPKDSRAYTAKFDRFYSRIAFAFDWFVKLFPLWRHWLNHVLPWIEGPRVLEVSFGTGYLLSQYANEVEAHGVDLNGKLARIASQNVKRSGKVAHLQIANVEALPYADQTFDTLVNTMAFSGYPDGRRAFEEFYRVLRPAGRLVLLDVSFPSGRSILGTGMTKLWQAAGDIIRDVNKLCADYGFACEDREIGGFGSIHLYLAIKSAKR
jgi:ubiquinone/menaquinone biosynthesis C-methylase UbiE